MAGILLLNLLAAVASGGGRELISRDQGGPHPISPTTDHLGALLMAPLNISWMIQAWLLLGSMAFSFGAGVQLSDGDVMTVSFDGFGRPLRNPVKIDSAADEVVAVTRLD